MLDFFMIWLLAVISWVLFSSSISLHPHTINKLYTIDDFRKHL